MSDRYWKRCERRFARFFGSERVRGSGSGVGHRGNVEETTSDSHNQRLYGEVKSASGPTGSNGWIWRWLRNEGWPHGLVEITDGLYCAHSSYIGEQLTGPRHTQYGFPSKGWDLYDKVIEAAAREQKVPLIALFCKGKRGWWFVGEPGGLLAAIKEREKVCASLTPGGHQG